MQASKINMVLFLFCFCSKWVSLLYNHRHYLAELETWSSIAVHGSMDVVSKDLVSQASSQWLRSPVSEHILMSPPKKKKVRAPWSTCVSTRFLWVQFFRVRSFFFPIAFQSLETRESNTWLISPHSFPLFLTCFRNIVSIHGQMYGTGSPLFGSMFSPPPHQSLLGEYLQMIMKMKCWGFPKPKCPALGVHRCGSCLFNDTLCNPQGEGWDSAQRGILCDDSTSKSWAKMQTSWVRCHPEIGCEQGCCTGRILCFSKKRSYAWERG